MSRDQKQDESLLEDREQLIEYFRDGMKSPESRRVGTEHEKLLFHTETGQLLNFDEIEELLGRLADRFGYERAYDEGRLVALERNDEAITLEPGGQFELSGGLKKTIHETEAELLQHFAELKEAGGPGLGMTCLGLNPYDDIQDIGWVPKSRYKIMRDYLPTRGDLSHWMMKLTCTIQANVDFVSEQDAADLMRTAYLISPIAHALFANSSVDHGKPNGFQSFRGHIWTRMDPDRTGVPPFVLEHDWGFGDYLDYVLDVPLFFIRRDGRYVNLAGQSFRTLMEDGIDGHRATMGDFELHLSTAFPEVRMKRYVEVRSGDGGPVEHMTALPAFWKGLLYDAQARSQAYERLAMTRDELLVLMDVASRQGIHGQIPGGDSILEMARDLIAFSGQGLNRLAQSEGYESEISYLKPLERILETRESAADLLRADVARLTRRELFLKHSI